MTLENWLTANGKSDAWLASQVGVSRPFITRIRQGVRQPSLEVVVKLADVTGLPPATFLKDRAA